MSWRGSKTVLERIFSCLPYLLPLIEGLEFGSFLFRQFPRLTVFLLPLFSFPYFYLWSETKKLVTLFVSIRCRPSFWTSFCFYVP